MANLITSGNPLGTKLIFKTANGYIYSSVIDTSTLRLHVYRSTDGGSTWTESDSTNAPYTYDDGLNSAKTFNGAIDSQGLIHYVYGSSLQVYKHAIFNTNTNAWGLNETALTLATAVNIITPIITIDKNDVPHIALISQQSGSAYNNIYTNKIGGSWNAQVTFDANTVNVQSIDLLVDNNNIPIIASNSIGTYYVYAGNANNATSFSKYQISTASFGYGAYPVSIAQDDQNNTWVGMQSQAPAGYVTKHNNGDAWSIWSTPVTNGISPQYNTRIAIAGRNVVMFWQPNTGAQNIQRDTYNGVYWSGYINQEIGGYTRYSLRYQNRNMAIPGDIDIQEVSSGSIYYSKVQLDANKIVYSFDAHADTIVNDANSWSSPASAFDTDRGTAASTNVNSTSSGGYLQVRGTNSTTTGGPISAVRVRIDGQGGNDNYPFWSSWQSINAPLSGWTWPLVNNLIARFWAYTGDSKSSGYIGANITNYGTNEQLGYVEWDSIHSGPESIFMMMVEVEVTYASYVTGVQQHGTSAVKKYIQGASHNTDANKKKANQVRTHSTSALKRTSPARSHQTNANLKATGLRSFSTDTNKRKANLTVQHSTDALKRTAISRTHNTDANKKKQNNTVSHLADAFTRSLQYRSHGTSAVKRKAATLSQSTSAVIRKTNTRLHTTDANKRRSNVTVSHATSSVLRKITTRQHTTDSYIQPSQGTLSTDYYNVAFVTTIVTATVAHSTDALKRKASTASHSTDTLKRKNNTLAHSTSSVLRKQFVRTHSTDTIKRATLTKNHSTSAVLRTTVTKSHSTDTLKRTATIKSHSTDALKRSAIVRTHSTDANKRKVNVLSHSTDALKRRAYSASHSTSANLRKSGVVKPHNTDALLRKVNVVSHSTQAVLRRGSQVSHNTNALLRAIKQYSHTTDTVKLKARRFNFIPNPSFENGVSGWNGYASNFAVDNTVSYVGTSSAKVTSTGGDGGIYVSGMQYKASTQYTMSARIKGTAGDQVHLQNNQNNGGSIYGATFTLTGGWDLVTFTFTTTATNSNGSAEIKALNAGQTFWVDAFMVEYGPVATPYFDGNSINAGWQGATNGSTSYSQSNVYYASHSTGAVLRRASSINHSTNAVLRRAVTKTHSTDSNKRKANSVSHSTDTITRKANVVSHSTSAQVRKSFNVSHTTDSQVLYQRRLNLVANPSVETNLNGVSTHPNLTITRSNEASMFGNYSVKVEAANTGGKYFTVDAGSWEIGKTYTFSAFLKQTVTSGKTSIGIRAFGDSGIIAASSQDLTGTQPWTRVYSTLTIPAGTTSVQWILIQDSAVAPFTLYYDGFMVEEAKVQSFNQDFENYPSSNGLYTSNNTWVITGNGNDVDQTNAAYRFKYRWMQDNYNTTGVRGITYDTVIKHGGTASLKLVGTDVKERVNFTLGRRNYGDLNDPVDIRTNLIPVYPNVTYTLGFWYKMQVDSVTGNPYSANRLIEAIEHSPTGLTASSGIYLPSTVTTDWTYGTLVFTTNANTRFLNIFGGMRGNPTDYWSGTLWFDDLTLAPTGNLGNVLPTGYFDGDQINSGYRTANNKNQSYSTAFTPSIGHSTDALKRKQFTKAHSTDAIKRKANVVQHATDANKRTANLVKTHNTDALKRKNFTRAHATDAQLRKAYVRSHTADAFKRTGTELSHNTSAIKRTTLQRSHSTDSLKRKSFTRSFTTDANKRKTLTRLHTTDANKRVANLVRVHSTSANKRKATTVAHSTNALLRKTSVIAHTTDAIKRKGNVAAHSTDALLRARYTYQHQTDTVKLFARRINLAANPSFETSLTGYGTAASATTTRDTTRSFSGSASMKIVQTTANKDDWNTLSSYGPLKANTDYTFSAWLYVESFTAGAFANRGLLITNAAISSVPVTTIDSSTPVGQWIRQQVTINTGSGTSLQLRLYAPQGTVYWDAVQLEEGTVATPYFDGSSINAAWRGTANNSQSYTLANVYTPAHSTSAVLRKQVAKTHTTDALKRKTTTSAHSTSANKRKASVVSHSTGTFLRKQNIKTHTTSANKRKSLLTKVHTTSANKRKFFSVSHNTSAIVRKSFIVAHFTDANKRVANVEIYHVTDANLRRAQIVVHSTDTLVSNSRAIKHTTDASLYSLRGTKMVLVNGTWVHGVAMVLIDGEWHIAQVRYYNGSSWPLTQP